jgi:[acyl-carrier-protein] S-malonyltransferase
MSVALQDRLVAAGFAFRGYNVTNLGRSAELLAHPAYGPVVTRYLREASEICSEQLRQPIDLVERISARRESTLDTFAEDIGLIIAMELAQLELLRQFFGVDYSQARLAVGYSLGEISALVAGGVFRIEDVLRPLVTLAPDCAELARDTTMGVVFSRGPAIDAEAANRLCLHITSENRGMIAISSYLSPNTLLVIGQYDTVDRFKALAPEFMKLPIQVRKNNSRWPPLHTSLLWQKNITNRASVMMSTMSGGFRAPHPPVLSLVTGKMSYNDFNSREMLVRWLDQPQRLWDAIYELLSIGTEVLIHVGPDPNLMPATFKRLSDNITAQFRGTRFTRLRMSTMRNIGTRAWLHKVLPARVALLRAPFVTHIILEDWLLEQPLPA